jgi:hypothetical protein
MDLDQEVVFSVSHGQDRRWHVTTQDSPQPLVSFDDPQAACAWAIERAKPRRGKVFVEKRATATANSLRDRVPAPDLFEYWIPVIWTDSADSRFKTGDAELSATGGARYRRRAASVLSTDNYGRAAGPHRA